MNLLVMSHKQFWLHADVLTTDGGFVLQIQAVAGLFEHTDVIIPLVGRRDQEGMSFSHPNIKVHVVTKPMGRGIFRKFGLVLWMFRNAKVLLKCFHRCDAVHTPIPGDIGTLGLFMARIMGKRLFIRYCGNWTNRRTLAEHLWHRIMRAWHPPNTITMATGGGLQPPDPEYPWIPWIFATSLKTQQLEKLKHRALQKVYVGDAPRLLFAGRLEPGKGIEIAMHALKFVRETRTGATLTVVGDGSLSSHLKSIADRERIEGIDFTGQVGHGRMLDLMISAHILVFPSLSEGFPKVVIESLACGVPVICRKVSVLGYLINGHNGFSSADLTPSQIAASVEDIYVEESIYRTFSNSAIASAQDYSLEAWQSKIRSTLNTYWDEFP